MNRLELRKKYGYDENDFILIYIAEFIPRKNHVFLLNAIPALREKIPGLKVILPGKGTLLKDMKKLAVDLEIDDIVRFLGYRKDVNDLLKISDVHVATSLQEGQGINNIEAMACGLPIVVSNIRGHRDVCVDGRNGFLFDFLKPNSMIEEIISLHDNKKLYENISNNNIADSKKFSVKIAVKKMSKVYDEVNESDDTIIVSEWGGVIVFDLVNSAASSFGRRAA